MKLGRAVATVALGALLSGCGVVKTLLTTPASAKIAGYANDYHYFESRYTPQCVADKKLPIEACKAAYVALLDVKADLEQANDALKRGGALRYQMAKLKADIKRLEGVPWATP